MTVTQIVIIVIGLFVGYRLVSYMLSPGTGDQGTRAKPASDRPKGGGDRRWYGDESAWSDASAATAPDAAPTWYQTLEVAESASVDQIERAYRVQISRYHPDKVANLGADLRELAEARSKEINAAYDTAMRLRRGH